MRHLLSYIQLVTLLVIGFIAGCSSEDEGNSFDPFQDLDTSLKVADNGSLEGTWLYVAEKDTEIPNGTSNHQNTGLLQIKNGDTPSQIHITLCNDSDAKRSMTLADNTGSHTHTHQFNSSQLSIRFTDNNFFLADKVFLHSPEEKKEYRGIKVSHQLYDLPFDSQFIINYAKNGLAHSSTSNATSVINAPILFQIQCYEVTKDIQKYNVFNTEPNPTVINDLKKGKMTSAGKEIDIQGIDVSENTKAIIRLEERRVIGAGTAHNDSFTTSDVLSENYFITINKKQFPHSQDYGSTLIQNQWASNLTVVIDEELKIHSDSFTYVLNISPDITSGAISSDYHDFSFKIEHQ